MPLFTDEQWDALLTEVGDDGTSTTAGTVDLRRQFVEDYAQSMAAFVTSDTTYGPQLEYHYAKLKAIDLLMGTVRRRVTFGERDRRVELNRLLQNLLDMKKEAQTSIQTLTVSVGSQGGTMRVAVGTLTASGNATAYPGLPDTNDSYYRGEPYKVSPGIQGSS